MATPCGNGLVAAHVEEALLRSTDLQPHPHKSLFVCVCVRCVCVCVCLERNSARTPPPDHCQGRDPQRGGGVDPVRAAAKQGR